MYVPIYNTSLSMAIDHVFLILSVHLGKHLFTIPAGCHIQSVQSRDLCVCVYMCMCMCLVSELWLHTVVTARVVWRDPPLRRWASPCAGSHAVSSASALLRSVPSRHPWPGERQPNRRAPLTLDPGQVRSGQASRHRATDVKFYINTCIEKAKFYV